ncbi:MAG: Hsp70 family protein, partial [Minisyncoccia bacterium]
NLGEQLVYTAEKALKDAGDKVPADVKANVEAKISSLKAIKDSGTLDEIKKATEELSTELQKVGQAMNNQATGGAQQTPPSETPPTEPAPESPTA